MEGRRRSVGGIWRRGGRLRHWPGSGFVAQAVEPVRNPPWARGSHFCFGVRRIGLEFAARNGIRLECVGQRGWKIGAKGRQDATLPANKETPKARRGRAEKFVFPSSLAEVAPVYRRARQSLP